MQLLWGFYGILPISANTNEKGEVMSELYENIKKWALSLPYDAIVGTPMKSTSCLVATYLGRPLFDDDFVPEPVGLPEDVIHLTGDFDYLARDTFPERIPVTAGEARELFLEKDSLTEEKTVVE